MGRPINPRKIGDGSGKIQVTSFRFTGESEAQAPEAHITRQRSTNQFVVTDGTTTEVLTLVNKSQGGLSEGEFIINAKDSSGLSGQVTRLYNRKVQVNAGDNDQERYKYTISDSNAASDAVRTIDSQSS